MISKVKDLKLGIIGLGYVGLPLALEFAKKRSVIGYDINENRINELKLGKDRNKEFKKYEIKFSDKLKFSNNIEDLRNLNCYIISVPTPINKIREPNLKLLFAASEAIGRLLKDGDIIIYESTVYPGCIEDDCIPILEKFSKLKLNVNFFCGYSPERINPGDLNNRLTTIKKVTSGSNKKTADLIDELYNEIIIAGTYKAPSIKIAEAAKVIENTQRDLNIALINELAILFEKMNINTYEVLEAAKSKWNFLPFKPGLVGGHCIGVDPYYLTYKAEKFGYHSKIILAGRKLNDNMGFYVASVFLKELKKKSIKIKKSKILIMGLAFKENCADIRNSGIKNVYKKLKQNMCNIDLYDTWVNREEIFETYGTYPEIKLNYNYYDGIIIAVSHDKFKKLGANFIKKLCKKKYVIYDLKNLFNKNSFITL